MFQKLHKLLVRDSLLSGLLIIGNNLSQKNSNIYHYFPKDKTFFIDPCLSNDHDNCYNVVLSNISEQKEYHVYNDTNYNSLCEFNDHEDYKHIIKIRTECTQTFLLDDLKKLKHVNMILLDTNGNEFDVLKGGEKLLQNVEYLCIRSIYNKLYKNSNSYEHIEKYLLENGWTHRSQFIRSSDFIYNYFIKLKPSSKYYVSSYLEGGLGSILLQIFHTYQVSKDHNLQMIFSDQPFYQNLNSLTQSPINTIFQSDSNNNLKIKLVNDDEYNNIKFNTIVNDCLVFNKTNYVPPFTDIKFNGYYKSYMYSEDCRSELLECILQSESKSSRKMFSDLNTKAMMKLIQSGAPIGEHMDVKLCLLHICRERGMLRYNADQEYYENAIIKAKEYVGRMELNTTVVFVMAKVKEGYLEDDILYKKIKNMMEKEVVIEIEIDSEMEAFYLFRKMDMYILNNDDLGYVGWYMNDMYKEVMVTKPSNILDEPNFKNENNLWTNK